MAIDKLEDMYALQKQLQSFFKEIGIAEKSICDFTDIKDKQAIFQQTLLLIMREVTEVLDEVNFKPHRLIKKEVDKTKILEELIDILKYWMNLCLIFNFSIDDIYTEFINKDEKVRNRALQEKEQYDKDQH